MFCSILLTKIRYQLPCNYLCQFVLFSRSKILSQSLVNMRMQCLISIYCLGYYVINNDINLLMASGKHVKNIELVYENKPICISHQRNLKYEEGKQRPQDMNFWKIFSRMPRTNSCSQKQAEEKLSDCLSKDDQKLIVICSFKNTQTTIDSLSKHFRMHRQKAKRYVSDEDLQFTGSGNCLSKNQDKNGSGREYIEEENEERNLIKQQIPKSLHYQQQQNKSDIFVNKRSVLSGNYSQLKSKSKINREIGKKFTNLKDGIDSNRKLPQLKEEKSYPVSKNDKKEFILKLQKKQPIPKQEKKYPALLKDPEELKEVKAENFIIVEYPSQKIIVSHKASVVSEVASLTKIMTFYTVIKIAESLSIDISSTIVTVSDRVLSITGTSADLVEGEEYSVLQLLYGLMLPSGNDAANELALWGGQLLSSTGTERKSSQKRFIGEMNKNAIALGMKNTNFCNPHGLPHQEAKSTASDMAKLCCVCMEYQIFRTIVSCKLFKATIKNGTSTKLVQWQNTNKLLRREGFIGLKTGITVTAGPCLAAAYSFRGQTYISVLLRAPKVSARFKQTRLLLHWALSKLHNGLSETQKLQLKRLKRHDRQLDSDNSEDQMPFSYGPLGQRELKKRCNILNYEL